MVGIAGAYAACGVSGSGERDHLRMNAMKAVGLWTVGEREIAA